MTTEDESELPQPSAPPFNLLHPSPGQSNEQGKATNDNEDPYLNRSSLYTSTLPSPPIRNLVNNDAFRDTYVPDNTARTPGYPMPRYYHSEPRRPNASRVPLQRRESLDVPIDSDTLLPISPSFQDSLITSSTAPTPHLRFHRQQQQLSDVTSAITTSPTTREEMCSPGVLSTRSSKSELFGESISVSGRMSTDSLAPFPQETSQSNKNEGYYYSPGVSEADFEDVELQADLYKGTDAKHHLMNGITTIGGRESLGRPKIAAIHPKLQKLLHYVGDWTQKEILPRARTVNLKAQRLIHHYRPPPSPRSRNMADLNYLRNSHKAKVDKLSDIEHENYFDFALVLTSQEVYAFWADLLDFRVEQLGEEAVQEMNETALLLSNGDRSPKNSVETVPSSSTEDSLYDMNKENEGNEPPMALKAALPYCSTPSTGMHRRRGKQMDDQDMTTPGANNSFHTTPAQRLSVASPYCIATSTQKSVVPRLSLFERALGPIPSTPAGKPSDSVFHQPTEMYSNSKIDATPNTTFTTNRRRWGPHSLNGALQTPNCMMSPPIRSLSHGGSSVAVKRASARTRANSAVPEERGNDDDDGATHGGSRRHDRNTLRLEDIPSQVIPRGIAARTNGMLQFLSVLKRGIVVRRHRSGMEAIFCKIVSNDGGDIICFEYVEPEEAMNAFKEQRVRYNRIAATGKDIAQPWSYVDDNDDGSVFQNHNFSVPDFIAAKQFREKMNREQGLSRKVNDVVTKVSRSGKFRASDMVAVHPARHDDPRSDKGQLGTATLRKSKSAYSTQLTFSVVCRAAQRFPGGAAKANLESYENKWYNGEGSDVQFRYVDFEAATEGEYWLIFRGFLLLHRDAAAGRFAAHRTAGIGSHVNRLELEQREQADLDIQNTLHRDEFHEPVTVGCMEKLVVKARKLDTTYMEGYCLPGAVPPPSDYFLGFRSPGTQIWSRLRQAGLETHRIYNVDTRSVLIKIRCPEDRLMDVAEVLHMKLRTRQGQFAPFREDTIDQFQPLSDGDLEAQNHVHATTLFRSAHRHTIIDFIIGSRIRDSGAELGQTTDLGKMIAARVPLHVPGKIDELYQSWCHFWLKDNWTGRDGCSLKIEKETAAPDKSDSQDHSKPNQSILENHIPTGFYRFFVGSFFQPLDSVEEYFGEKVAFYFAWLQHCSMHMLFLTGAGLIVFMCQMVSQNFDHPIRPYWSVVIMFWSFTVLINWRKRSNFLAHRWGTIDYKEQETTRPQFKGKYVIDEITQEWVVRYPKWKRWLKYLISFPLTLAFTFGSLIIILLFHANRDLHMAKYLEGKSKEDAEPFRFTFSLSAIGETAPITDVEITSNHFTDPTFLMVVVGLPSILGLSLPLLNFILMNVSYMLNDFENYRTHSEYRTNLIIKVFSFRFVCYFASLYYYAFVSLGSETAIENGIFRVATGVLIYTTVAHWWTLLLQIYFPLLIYKIRMRLRNKRLLKELAKIEMEEDEILNRSVDCNDGEATKAKQLQLVNKRLLLDQAQDKIWLEALKPQHDSFPEYIQAVVQFAYVACFSVVLPITPFIVLVNYLACMRLDAYKICKVRRRPLSEKTGGIGVWEHLLHIVVVISVLTNCWLMGFTHSRFLWIGAKLGNVGQFAFVVGFEHCMLLIKYVMHATCSALPKSVRDEIRREQHRQARQRNVTMQEKKRRSQYNKASSYRTLRSNSATEMSIKSATQKVLRWSTVGDVVEESSRMTETSRMSEF